jgi:glutamine synthetase
MFELKTTKDVLKIVKEKNVSFIQFWFTDVLGVQKIFSITPSELQEWRRGWASTAPPSRGSAGSRRAT